MSFFGDKLNGDEHKQKAVEMAPPVMEVVPVQTEEEKQAEIQAEKEAFKDEITSSVKSE